MRTSGMMSARVRTTYLCYDASVLCVHHGNGTELLARLEHIVQFGVVQHKHVLVGHEDFERVDSCQTKPRACMVKLRVQTM